MAEKYYIEYVTAADNKKHTTLPFDSYREARDALYKWTGFFPNDRSLIKSFKLKKK